MSYIKHTLMDHEQLLYYIRPHWITFTQTIFWAVVTLAILIASYFIPQFNYQYSPHLPPLSLMAAGFTLILTAFCGLRDLTTYFSSEYAITNKRIFMKRGFLRRQTNEIFISKVEGIKVKQTILGRLCNYGTLIISGTGGNQEPFAQVPQPLRFRANLQQQLDAEHSPGQALILHREQ